MKVIIPAAGLGSRLRPHTFTTPKALLPVAGKPIIGHILDQVISWGGDEVALIIGHLGEQIKRWVSSNYDLKVSYHVQEEMLGLGHAIHTGLQPEDKEVLIILGDTILGMSMNSVINERRTSIGVKEVEDPRKLGVVVVKDEKVVELVEKPEIPVSNLAIVGVYYISDGSVLYKALSDIISRNVTVKGEYQVTDALQVMVDWGEEISTFPVNDWYDCGRPETLLETNRYLFESGRVQATTQNFEGASIIPPVSLGDGVRIESSIVGPFVSIGQGTVIRNTILKNSIVGNDTCIENSVLVDSLVGSRAYVKGPSNKINIGQSSQYGY